MSIWGQLAAATIGAIGARKSAKAMRGANDLDLAKLRREAEQNGFNPLTVLRATGGQGSTKGPTGNLASGAFFQTFAQGIPSILEANYNKKMKAAQLENVNLQNEQMTVQIAGLNNPYKPMDGFLDPEKRIDGNDRYFTKADGTPTEITRGTNLMELTYDQIRQIPAQQFEDEYGDLASMVFGVLRLGSDVLDVANQKAAIKAAKDEYNRRIQFGTKKPMNRIQSNTDLYSDAVKVINRVNKKHPRNTNRGNHGKLAPL